MSEMHETQARQPSLSVVRIAGDETRGWRLGIIGKRTWTIAKGRPVLADEQVQLVEEPLYDEGRAVLLHDADVLLQRKKVDVVVEGHVYPAHGVSPTEVLVRVGAFERRALAFGPRRVFRSGGGRISFTVGEPIDKIPLTWESAYGGVDEAARADIGDPFEAELAEARLPADPRFGLFAYPRNPVGRGYIIEPTLTALESCELPLLESPQWRLTSDNLVREDFVRWPEGPPVAGFGWLSYDYFPRSALLGVPPLVYDGERLPPSSFEEVRDGHIHAAAVRGDRPIIERLHLSVAQSAAIGMRAEQVRPLDVVEFVNLHARDRRWCFTIPEETPRMFFRFPGGERTEMPLPEIRTVLLQPDVDRLTLVWTAETDLPSVPAGAKLAGMQHVVQWR